MQRVNSLLGSWQSQKALFLVVLLVVAVDQLSKLWVSLLLEKGESLPQEGILRLTHVTNEGIIFGLPTNQTLSLVLPILIMVAALLFYFQFASGSSGSIKAALGLLVGGSLGNLVDRLRFSYVTDFIDLRLWGDFHWPVFNLADLAIVIGAILLAYSLLRLKKSPRQWK